MNKGYSTIHEKYILILTGILAFLILLLSSGCQQSRKKSILVIHSYNKTNRWIESLDKGISDCLKSNRIVADIETIYLEDALIDIKEESRRLTGILDSFNNRPFDLIFVCDDKALLSILTTDHPSVHTIPVVFCGIDYIPYDLLSGFSNITGFATTPDFEKCYQLARQLLGKIEAITLIAEDTPSGASAISSARDQFKKFHNITQIQESYWSYSETDTFNLPGAVVNPLQVNIERIDMMPGSLLKNILRDKLNSFCILPQWRPAYALLPRMGTAPFFMVNNEGFGDGQIGGYMTPGYNQTYEAMETAVKILKGARPTDFVITQSKQYPVFDWEQLQFRKIDIKRLPADSIIHNIPFAIRYKKIIISSLFIFGILFILFVLVLTKMYKRESAHKKQVKDRLEKEQKELDITLDSLTEGLVSVNTDGEIQSMNKAAKELLGLKQNISYFGYTVWDLFDIQERGNPFYLKNLLDRLSTNLGSFKLSETAYIITKNKKAFTISGSISSLYDNENLYGSVISFHNTTDEFTQKEYLALSMIAGDIFPWRYDQISGKVLFDESFFKLYNLTDDGSHTLTVDQLIDIIHPDDKENWESLVLDILQHKQKLGIIRLRMNLSGTYSWWEYRLSHLPKSLSASRYSLVGICMSIERFKQTERELIRLRDEAEKSDHEKGLFLANMSHEVRTPLNSIVGFSTLLIEDESLSLHSRNEFMSIINENCRLLLKLINEILDLTRIDSGIAFRKEACYLNRIIEEVISEYPAEKHSHVEIEIRRPDYPVIIQNDSFRLRQIIQNLLDNAFKFTDKGRIVIGYEHHPAQNQIILFIKDSGIGITEEDMPRIFERFYKSHEFKQGGGLGLPIVKEVVERMNGTIHVDSHPGKGTTFTINLPIGDVSTDRLREE